MLFVVFCVQTVELATLFVASLIMFFHMCDYTCVWMEQMTWIYRCTCNMHKHNNTAAHAHMHDVYMHMPKHKDTIDTIAAVH